MRRFVNMWAEKHCSKCICNMHKSSPETLYNPDFIYPWWFKYMGRLEFATRKTR